MATARPKSVSLVALALTGMSVAAGPASASAALVAELAIVTASSEGDGDLEGYLVIWNGLAKEVHLETVADNAGAERIRPAAPRASARR